MDKVKFSAVYIVGLILSYAMVVTKTYAEPILNLGPVEITLPYLIFIISLILLVHTWTPVLETFVKIMMSGAFVKIVFGILIFLGTIALIELMINTFLGFDINVIGRLVNWYIEI